MEQVDETKSRLFAQASKLARLISDKDVLMDSSIICCTVHMVTTELKKVAKSKHTWCPLQVTHKRLHPIVRDRKVQYS